MPDSPSVSLPDDLSFEQAIQRLEEIVQNLEGDLPHMDEAIRSYEEGVLLARYCLERLNSAEMRIQELSLE